MPRATKENVRRGIHCHKAARAYDTRIPRLPRGIFVLSPVLTQVVEYDTFNIGVGEFESPRPDF